MIITINKAILHVLDAVSGSTTYSDSMLDMENPVMASYINNHIERIYDDPALRTGDFNSNSGFLYNIKQYISNDLTFEAFSKYIAEKLYELISGSDNIHSCDIIVCDFLDGDTPVLAILKCDNKTGHIHKVIHEASSIRNEIVNYGAILPSVSQKISECAFIRLDTFNIRYKSKKIVNEGEKIDLLADGLLECIYDISSKEAFNSVERIAKKVSKEYGGDGINEAAKIKDYVKNTALVKERIDLGEISQAVFDSSPTAREEFMIKTQKAMIPETFEMNEYITKKINKNIKIISDNGIEIAFPVEYYNDGENIEISENEDGTISIHIKNIKQLENK